MQHPWCSAGVHFFQDDGSDNVAERKRCRACDLHVITPKGET